MRNRSVGNTVRRGYSFLELQVAFVLLGIALAGLTPLVVMQSRQLRMLEARFDPQTTYYLVPSTDAWAGKLGAPATIETADPGTAPAPVTLIDNGDPGYYEIDYGLIDWTTVARPTAFEGTLRRQDGSGIGDAAVWEFANLQPGWYEVLVTYAAAADQATNAPFSVYDGAVCDGTVPINQTQPPSGAVFQGVPWESLGLFSISGDTLKVKVVDYANGYIVADAVRIVPVRNEVQVLSLERPLLGEDWEDVSEDVTVSAAVTANTP
jgi:hypothetical protein